MDDLIGFFKHLSDIEGVERYSIENDTLEELKLTLEFEEAQDRHQFEGALIKIKSVDHSGFTYEVNNELTLSVSVSIDQIGDLIDRVFDKL